MRFHPGKKAVFALSFNFAGFSKFFHEPKYSKRMYNVQCTNKKIPIPNHSTAAESFPHSSLTKSYPQYLMLTGNPL
jgi:hypothetical protein